MVETFLVIISVVMCLTSIVMINVGCSHDSRRTRRDTNTTSTINEIDEVIVTVVEEDIEETENTVSLHNIDADFILKFNSECPICLDDIQGSENVYALNCDHVYHEKCIIQWFQRSRKLQCPLCLQ